MAEVRGISNQPSGAVQHTAASSSRCPSVDPWSGDLQCVKQAGHADEQHVYQGIAWTDADEAVTSLTLTHTEIGLAIDGVSRLVQSPVSEASPLLRKLQRAYEETKR